jgi:hypothetical protein
MLEYYGKRLCIPARELVERGVMSAANYQKMATRKKIDIARTARGKGNYALIAVDSLPETYRDEVTRIYPDGEHVRLLGWLRSNYAVDQCAVAYFMNSSECGVELKPEKVKEYVNNASVLNTCIKLYNNAKMSLKLMGKEYDWSMMSTAIEGLREEFGHTLPSSTLRFRKKVAEYKRDGYVVLISGKYGNQSARKVDFKTERLILAIAILPNKPFNTSVHEMYNMFVCGELEVFDPKTGELFDPDDFMDKNGEPNALSETTINNYLNKPNNRALIEHATTSWTTFMHAQAPHVHRHAPEFSFSKISFDDRDLPRKLKDTKARAKAYYAYDVTSQCVVGYAYNRNKNVDLVVDCFRSMFRLIERKCWCVPAQVEVENHLMSQWRDSFLKAGVLFPFVRFCAPQNSQEKYAEPMNGAKKRSIEHKNHLGIGRFYAKGRHYRTESKKISDESNDTYEDKEYYDWDELIADDMRDINEFNNSLHPNQKKYKGMTRWEVLEANMNPTLEAIDKSVLARFIGEKVETSIRRNSYCRVSYEDWWLSRTDVIEKLEPNNWKVDAYYLTDSDGNITNVYIYQGDMLIDELQRVGTFNTADCEQTDEDKEIFVNQQKKISSFRKYIKDHEIDAVGVMKKPSYAAVAAEEVSMPVVDEEQSDDVVGSEDYAASALEEF